MKIIAGLSGLAVKSDVPARMTVMNPYTRMPVLHAETNEPAWVDVLSESSKAGTRWLREATDKALARRGRTAKADDLDADLCAKAARLTTGWFLLNFSGEPIDVDYSPAMARDLFAMPEMTWLREQVLEFAGDLGNYRTPPSTASLSTEDTSSGSTVA
jgi:hypothetical protein